ncbi:MULTISPECIES: hypothetical protein [Paenibacillus]|uniref:hypothetical protein n=1 Tax=Paenibacillus TaxID=44249 RepID=UPI00039C18D1|nr:hypothetical protein [Paenibacillus massiliensis]
MKMERTGHGTSKRTVVQSTTTLNRKDTGLPTVTTEGPGCEQRKEEGADHDDGYDSGSSCTGTSTRAIDYDKLQKEGYIVVCAPTSEGEEFIKLLRYRGEKVAGLTNNAEEKTRLERLGVEHTIIVNTRHEQTWVVPSFPVKKLYIFERSLTQCSRYIQICRSWTCGPLIVITDSRHSRLMYKSLGADDVLYCHRADAILHTETM